MCGEGVPYGDYYPASEEKFMSICFSKWNRKFEWMTAEITGVNFEEQIWVNRITSGDNIESHDEVKNMERFTNLRVILAHSENYHERANDSTNPKHIMKGLVRCTQ